MKSVEVLVKEIEESRKAQEALKAQGALKDEGSEGLQVHTVEPVVEKPVVKKPVVKKPVIEEPVVKKPVVEKPVKVKPVEKSVGANPKEKALEKKSAVEKILEKILPIWW